MVAGWSTQCRCGQPLIWLSQKYEATKIILAFMELAGGFECADVHPIAAPESDDDRWAYCSKCHEKIWPPYTGAPVIVRVDADVDELRFGDRDEAPAGFGPTGSSSGINFQAPALA